MFPYGETVTRIRPAAKLDPYSGEVIDLDWTNALELDIDGVGFDPGSSSEAQDARRDATTTAPTLYAQPGSDIAAGDRVRVRGLVYEVDGRPADWRSPFTGWNPGLVVTLRLMEG